MGVVSLLAGTVSHFLLCQPLFSKADPYESLSETLAFCSSPHRKAMLPVLSPLQLPVSPAASGLY